MGLCRAIKRDTKVIGSKGNVAIIERLRVDVVEPVNALEPSMQVHLA